MHDKEAEKAFEQIMKVAGELKKLKDIADDCGDKKELGAAEPKERMFTESEVIKMFNNVMDDLEIIQDILYSEEPAKAHFFLGHLTAQVQMIVRDQKIPRWQQE